MNAADPTATDDTKLATIIRFVADAADCDIAKVSPDSDIYNELGVDSLGAMAIFIDMAFEFGAPEPGNQFDFAAVNTPRKLLQYVNATQTSPDMETLLDLLPYGDGFRFVDRVMELADDTVVTSKRYESSDPSIAAHKVGGESVVPGVHLLEQAAQSALLLAMARESERAAMAYWLTKIDGQFHEPVRPPCEVVAETQVVRVQDTFGFRTACRVSDTLVASIKGVVAQRLSGS